MPNNFGEMGAVDITDTASLFHAAEFGRRCADDAAFAVAQFAADIEWALAHVPVASGSASRKARRVAKHAKRAVEQLKAVRESMRKIPEEFNRTYEEELVRIRNHGRPRFDINKGA